MTAFLFIPSTTGVGPGRRVNFADIANLFSELEAPPPQRRRLQPARIALMMLVLLGAIGDTLIVARPDALANCLSIGQVARPAASVAGS